MPLNPSPTIDDIMENILDHDSLCIIRSALELYFDKEVKSL